MQRKTSVRSLVFGFSFFVVLLAAWLQRFAIYDWLRLRNYEPPAAIVQLSSDTTMTPDAQRLFYVNHPVLVSSKETFNEHCPNNGGEHTIVLGCYHDNQTGIYLYHVTDEQLHGVLQVTAAHEMLHAIYERLSSSERARVDGLLQSFYQNDLKDERILRTIETYKKTEPNDVVNEMHAIFGTEVRNLPSSLEEYYKRYFANRLAVVGYSEQYQKVFSERKAQAESILAQLQQLKADLESLNVQINQTEQELQQQSAALEAERHTTQDPQAFNAKVNAYNTRVNQLRELIAEYNQKVGQHNDLLNSYQALAVETSELYKALDSRPNTVQAQ